MDDSGGISTHDFHSARYLLDVPASADNFGVHARLAQHLADLVENEPGGKLVGLEGRWGSGKSSVIEQTIHALTQNEDIHFITIDAWPHHGDPLRRSLLEELIADLDDAGWLDSKYAQVLTAEISGKSSEKTIRRSPKLTAFGVLFSLSLAVVPLGVGLLRVVFPTPVFTWSAALVVLLTLAPVVVALLSALSKWKSGGGFNMHTVLQEVQTQEEMQLVVESGYPTSIEYRRCFNKIIDAVLGKPNQVSRRLVIVIDNIDRVPPDEVKIVWSALRVFTEHGQRTAPDCLDRLWTIVPFDREQFATALLDGYFDSANENAKLAVLDKAFGIRLRVPPLLTDGWEEYLRLCFERAGLSGLSHEYDLGVRTARAFFYAKNVAPTPRDILRLANDVVTLGKLFGSQFELGVYVYYALCAKYHEDVSEKILSGAIPTAEARHVLGETLSESLLMLYFGVDTRQAASRILGRKIFTELSSRTLQISIDAVSNAPFVIPEVVTIAESALLTSSDGDADTAVEKAGLLLELADSNVVSESYGARLKQLACAVVKKHEAFISPTTSMIGRVTSIIERVMPYQSRIFVESTRSILQRAGADVPKLEGVGPLLRALNALILSDDTDSPEGLGEVTIPPTVIASLVHPSESSRPKEVWRVFDTAFRLRLSEAIQQIPAAELSADHVKTIRWLLAEEVDVANLARALGAALAENGGSESQPGPTLREARKHLCSILPTLGAASQAAVGSSVCLPFIHTMNVDEMDVDAVGAALSVEPWAELGGESDQAAGALEKLEKWMADDSTWEPEAVVNWMRSKSQLEKLATKFEQERIGVGFFVFKLIPHLDSQELSSMATALATRGPSILTKLAACGSSARPSAAIAAMAELDALPSIVADWLVGADWSTGTIEVLAALLEETDTIKNSLRVRAESLSVTELLDLLRSPSGRKVFGACKDLLTQEVLAEVYSAGLAASDPDSFQEFGAEKVEAEFRTLNEARRKASLRGLLQKAEIFRQKSKEWTETRVEIISTYPDLMKSERNQIVLICENGIKDGNLSIVEWALNIVAGKFGPNMLAQYQIIALNDACRSISQDSDDEETPLGRLLRATKPTD